MSVRKTQVLLVSGAIILFVLLFIAPKITSQKKESEFPSVNKKESSTATLDVYLNLALKNMESEKKSTYDKLQASKKTDSLVAFWDKLKRPDLASVFVEELAKKNNTVENWLNAGNRYYYSVQFSKDKTEVPVLYQSAMRCYIKALDLNPTNTDAKIMLASCYVEGTQDPMEGIKLMKEVEKIDSNNVKLQLSFAFFSVKSGQLDKAIARFNKVLKIDSTYIEAYLHLADAYEQRNQTEKTIEVLKKYAAKTNDITARIEINKYIDQLNTNH